jgi:hypothetical protein
MDTQRASASNEVDHSSALERIAEALRGLRFGEVTIVVQDGVVVQVERTERMRIREAKRP